MARNTATVEAEAVTETAEAPAPVSAEAQNAKIEELKSSIIVLEAERGAFDAAVKQTPAGIARDALSARLEEYDKKIAARNKQLENLTYETRYGEVTEPFLKAISTINIPDDFVGVGTIPATISVDKIEEQYKASAFRTFVLEQVLTAAQIHLDPEKMPADVWDKLRPLHFSTSEDKRTVSAKFADSKARATGGSGTGSGRGKALVYKIVGIPEENAGIAQIGDTFGPGTDNPQGKAFGEKIEPVRYPEKVAQREAGGGHVAPATVLKSLGYTLESTPSA